MTEDSKKDEEEEEEEGEEGGGLLCASQVPEEKGGKGKLRIFDAHTRGRGGKCLILFHLGNV